MEDNMDVKCTEQSASTKVCISSISGTLAGILSELIFYGLDSHKIVQQSNATSSITNSNPRLLLMKSLQGMLPITILGSGPSYGMFFLCYTPLHDHLKDLTQSESLSVLIASSKLKIFPMLCTNSNSWCHCHVVYLSISPSISLYIYLSNYLLARCKCYPLFYRRGTSWRHQEEIDSGTSWQQRP